MPAKPPSLAAGPAAALASSLASIRDHILPMSVVQGPALPADTEAASAKTVQIDCRMPPTANSVQRPVHIPKRQFNPARTVLTFSVLRAPAPIQTYSSFVLRFGAMPYSMPPPADNPR